MMSKEKPCPLCGHIKKDTPKFSEGMVEPKVTKRLCPGWLAVSPEGAKYRIGVTGPTEEETRERFFQAYERWDHVVQEATPCP